MLGLAGISGSGLRNEALMAICSEERSYRFRLTFDFHFIGVSTAGFCQVDRACIEAEIQVAEIGCSQVFSRNFAAQSLQVPAPLVPRSRKSRDPGHPIWYVGAELGHPPEREQIRSVLTSRISLGTSNNGGQCYRREER